MSVTTKNILKFNASHGVEKEDVLAIEEPLQISLSGAVIKTTSTSQNIAITMRTPGHDAELAAGFLYGEGILTAPTQIIAITADDNKVNFEVSKLDVDLTKLTKNFYTTSSCGVCGKSSIEAIQMNRETLTPTQQVRLNPTFFYGLQDKARQNQQYFRQTGGIHAATLFDTSGNIIAQYEDVGRHNALDKVIGAAFLKDTLPLDKHILLLSGRASFELLQKAVMAGIQLIVAIGAPSSLAVELADEYDVTLVGFLKADSFNVYSGQHRLVSG